MIPIFRVSIVWPFKRLSDIRARIRASKRGVRISERIGGGKSEEDQRRSAGIREMLGNFCGQVDVTIKQLSTPPHNVGSHYDPKKTLPFYLGDLAILARGHRSMMSDDRCK
jgi:hypothetical protein